MDKTINIDQTDNGQLQHEIEQFLYHEARLLDNRKWQDWNDLFAEDGHYWVPSTEDQENPLDQVSLFYENAVLRDVRMRRLEHQHAWSQLPPTRTARILGNVIVESGDAQDQVKVHSTFHLTEWRKGVELKVFGGAYVHDLVRADGGWKIRQKRVNLINSDAVHDPLEIFI